MSKKRPDIGLVGDETIRLNREIEKMEARETRRLQTIWLTILVTVTVWGALGAFTVIQVAEIVWGK